MSVLLDNKLLQKQIISKQLKFKKCYLNKCTGKPTTFKDLKAKQPKLPAATAQISPPVSTAYDSDDDCINNIISEMSFGEPMFGHRQIFVTGVSAKRVVDETNVPIYEEMLETQYIKDKVCVICQKSGMDLEKYKNHVLTYHNLIFRDPVEAWITAYSDSELENNEVANDSDCLLYTSDAADE